MDEVLYVAAGVAAVTAAVAAAAARLHWPAPILLVLAGLVLAVTPGLPRIALPPDLVLLVFLPPIIYYASFGMSWQAFRANLRPIVLLAVGCVIATTVAVAAAAHWVIGLAWPVAFVLGAIVSPPDVIAPLAIVRRLGLPSRIAEVLEGEGLVNDATALVLFSFALAAVTTGVFSISEATATFAAIVIGETLYGFFVGWAMLRLRYLANEPRIEVTLSLLTPFAAFWAPHAVGGSGVLATVVAGLYVGARGIPLIRSNTRLQAVFFWDFVTYLMNGAIFLLTGLQARTVIDGMDGQVVGRWVFYGLFVSLVVIAVRYAWVFPATYLPRRFLPKLRARDPSPPWQYPFVIAFTGVRGVVSLAAALSIPYTIGGSEPFPDRGLILFVTFVVILITLVAQGPSFAPVVRRLGLVEQGRAERRHRDAAEHAAQIEAARAALVRLEVVAAEKGLSAQVTGQLRAGAEARLEHLERRRDRDGDGGEAARQAERGELSLIKSERNHINGLATRGVISDEIRRRIERNLDLREEALRRNIQGVSSDD